MIVVSICSIFLIAVVALRRGPTPKTNTRRAGGRMSANSDCNEDDEEAHSKRDRDNAQDPSETEPILLSEPELGRTSVLHIR